MNRRDAFRKGLPGATRSRFRRPGVIPFWTRAENPPTKSTRHSSAAASSVLATCSAAEWPWPARIVATGEIASRLLMIGIPYFEPTFPQISTRRPACETILRCSLVHIRGTLGAAQSLTFNASVTVRTSRCSACNMPIVERISSVRSIVWFFEKRRRGPATAGRNGLLFARATCASYLRVGARRS